MFERDGNGVFAVERNTAREHFVKHDARRIQVASLGDGQPLCLLWREIVNRTQHGRTCERDGVCVYLTRNAKVHEFDLAALHDNYILRLYIAVDDARGMRGTKRIEHLHHKRDCDAGGHRPVFVDDIFERAPVYKFKYDIGQAVRLANVKSPHDVFMRKVQNGPCLALKAAEKLRVVSKLILEHLDGNHLAGTKVHCAVNMRHAACADELYNAIAMAYNGSLRNHSASSSSRVTRMTVMLSVPPLSSAS